MPTKFAYLIFFLSLFCNRIIAQEKEIHTDNDTKISVVQKPYSMVFKIKELRNNEVTNNPSARSGTPGDFTGISSSLQVEFDKNGNGIYDGDDWGIYAYSDYGWVLGYSLYPTFNGLRVHKLNRGFDIQTEAKLLELRKDSTGRQFSYTIEIPLKEITNFSSSKVSFKITLYRNVGNKGYGTFFSFPSEKGQFSKTFDVPVVLKEYNDALEKSKQGSQKRQVEQSKKSYAKSIDYNGVYIDMGNGQYAELKKSDFQNGVIAGFIGSRDYSYLRDIPFITTLEDAILVPKCQKVVFKGDSFQGDFLKYLSIHEMENLESKKILLNQGTSAEQKVKVAAYAGKFGSQYSLKSEQPNMAFSPMVDKSSLKEWIYIEFNKKTINETTFEIKLTQPLEKGKTYCIWSDKSYYLFTIQ